MSQDGTSKDGYAQYDGADGKAYIAPDQGCCCTGGEGGPCGEHVAEGCPCGTCPDLVINAEYRTWDAQGHFTERWQRQQHCCQGVTQSWYARGTAWLYGYDPLTGVRGPFIGYVVGNAYWRPGGGLNQLWVYRARDGFLNYYEFPINIAPEGPSGPYPSAVISPDLIYIEEGGQIETGGRSDGFWFLSCLSASWDYWEGVTYIPITATPGYYIQHVQGSSAIDRGGSACSPGCPTGACCCGGVCYGGVTFNECTEMGGRFAGPGSSCVDVDCTGRGACCFSDGSCQFLTPEECIRRRGIFQGAGIRCRDANCPQPMGICCNPACPNGCCGQTTMPECTEQGGHWYPGATDCSVCFQPPPRRPCCLRDGSCLDSQTSQECQDAGGVWQMNGTTCGATNCPVVGNACCYQLQNSHGQMVWTCVDGLSVTAESCAQQTNSTFYPNTRCDQINCPINPGSTPPPPTGCSACQAGGGLF